MMMQIKSHKKNYQKLNKRMGHMKIKKIDKKKKQIWSNKKVFQKHSPRSGGVSLLTPKNKF